VMSAWASPSVVIVMGDSLGPNEMRWQWVR
jgi:hypothetical protein